MDITVDVAPPGEGKTTAAQINIASCINKYLFVTERRETMFAIEADLLRFADQRGRHLIVKRIASDEGLSRNSVKEAVEALPNQYRDEVHVCAIITHAAMLMSDLSEFHGWHIVIDEIPAVLSVQEVQTKMDHAFFNATYQLAPLEGYSGWSTVSLTNAGRRVTSRDLYQDDSHRHLRGFHALVVESERSGSRRVVCNLHEWTEMGDVVDGTTARDWIWGSLFTLNGLSAFAGVTILGNRFGESLSYKLLVEAAAQDGLDVHWQFKSTTRPQQWQRRRVRLIYFTNRRSSRYHLSSEGGRDHLAKVDRFLADTLTGPMLWTTNDLFRPSFEHLNEGAFRQPRQAGSNDFAGCTSAAMIYSAKPSPQVEGLLAAHGVSRDDWIATNEFEPILQFLTRTAIRDPHSTEPLTFAVYDYEQARYVADRLGALAHVDLTVERIDLGIPELEKKKPGRKPSLTAEERQIRTRDQKANWARRNRAKAGAA